MTRAAAWRGDVGTTWADNWRRTDRAFAGIAVVLNEAIVALAPDHGRALDIGCGAGSTSLALQAARPGLRVTGCDLSASLIDVAVARAATPRAPHFLVADALDAAAALDPLDLLVSRHGVMFFDDPHAAFTRLHAAARSGAPLVFSCFQQRAANGWAAHVDTALGIVRPSDDRSPGPYAFAEPAYVEHILTGSGWRGVTLVPHVVPFVVSTGDDPVADALDFYRRIGSAAALLSAADSATRLDMEARLADMLSHHVRDGAVTFDAAIWIWTAHAGGSR